MTDEEFKRKYPALANRREKVAAGKIVEKEEGIKPSKYAKFSEEFRAKEAKRKRDFYARNKELLNAREREKRRTDPEFRDKERLRSKKRYEENRAAENARKTEWCQRNKARFRAQWNAWYQRVKDTKRGQQLASRIRNRPLYGLKGALGDFERGAIGVDELTRLYDRALARVNDVGSRGSKGREGRREIMGPGQHTGSKADSGCGEAASQRDETKIGFSESSSQDLKGHF